MIKKSIVIILTIVSVHASAMNNQEQKNNTLQPQSTITQKTQTPTATPTASPVLQPKTSPTLRPSLPLLVLPITDDMLANLEQQQYPRR